MLELPLRDIFQGWRKERMRHSKVYTAVALAASFFMAGLMTSACAQSNQPASGGAKSSSGKVIMKVGNVQVTQNEFESLLGSMNEQQIEQSGGKNAIAQRYATMLLLSQAAQSRHLDSTPAFQQDLRRARTNLLAQLENQDLVHSASVTPTEISQYYNAHAPDFQEAKVYEVALIKKSDRNTKGLTEAEAQAKSQEIRKALSSGQDIAAIAKQYNVPNQVDVVAEPQSIQNSGSLPAFAKAAFTMQPGALSEIEDRSDVMLFYKVASHGKMPLKDATAQIENKLRQQKYMDAIGNLKKQIPVWMDSSYFTSGPPAGADAEAQPKP